MRLPTLTRRHRQQEDARELHEFLWLQYQNEITDPDDGPNARLRIPSTPETIEKDRRRWVGNLHKFWLARGYALCSTTRGETSSFQVWLEVTATKVEDHAA